MNNRKILLGLTAIILSAISGAAQADDTRLVWRNSSGQYVHNTTGNCVRSRWNDASDVCATAQPPLPVMAYQPPPPMPPPAPRTFVAQEDRTVLFGFNKAVLTEYSRQLLDSLAARLQSAEDVQGANIVGYADRIGTASYNQALSKKRAEAVRDYLANRGFIKPAVTQTRWVGKSEPTTQCSHKLSRKKLIACLAPDRRVVVEMQYRTTVQPPQSQQPQTQYQQGSPSQTPVYMQPSQGYNQYLQRQQQRAAPAGPQPIQDHAPPLTIIQD